MWLFVLFDLPVGTKAERRAASKFRSFLKDDGFMMLQFSVYARVCRGEDGAMKHIARVTRNLPSKGSVRALQVTDRQYGRMKLLLGRRPKPSRLGRGKWCFCDFRPGKEPEITDFAEGY